MLCVRGGFLSLPSEPAGWPRVCFRSVLPVSSQSLAPGSGIVSSGVAPAPARRAGLPARERSHGCIGQVSNGARRGRWLAQEGKIPADGTANLRRRVCVPECD